MATISSPEKQGGRGRVRLARYQIKIALSYMAVIALILMLLNTYPMYVTQDSVFQSKKRQLMEQTSQVASALLDLPELTGEETSGIVGSLEMSSAYRVVVCDKYAKVLFDNSTNDSTVGRYALQGEIVRALSGHDVFRGRVDELAFESFTAMPVMTRGEIIGAVYLYEYDAEQAALQGELQSNLSVITVLVMIAVIVLSIFLSLALTRRISGLVRAIGAVGTGEYGIKAPVRGRDEIAEVARQFNKLSDRLSETETLRQQFVSDASHELKTPLAAIKLLADSMLQNENMDLETTRDFIADIASEVDRLSRTTEDLMLLTKLDSAASAEMHFIYPAPIIRRVTHMLRPLSEEAGVTIECTLDERAAVMGNYNDLYKIVFNLMENAIKYNRSGGHVRALCFVKDGKTHIVVSDTGVGIPEEERSKIFERFYRVDKARSRDAGGTGLGLSIVSRTAESLGGDVNVDSMPGKWTTFTVRFDTADKRSELPDE